MSEIPNLEPTEVFCYESLRVAGQTRTARVVPDGAP